MIKYFQHPMFVPAIVLCTSLYWDGRRGDFILFQLLYYILSGVLVMYSWYYILLLWYVCHVKLYIQRCSTDINAKHFIAHSHAWDTGRIVYGVLIANCKLTPVLVLIQASCRTTLYTSKQKAPKEERARQSSSSAKQHNDQLKTR